MINESTITLEVGVMVAILWGGLILIVLSVVIARMRSLPILPVVLEHMGIALLVILLSWAVGTGIRQLFA